MLIEDKIKKSYEINDNFFSEKIESKISKRLISFDKQIKEIQYNNEIYDDDEIYNDDYNKEK